MNPKPLISATDLAGRLGAAGLVVVDCRFDISDAAKGGRDYAGGHIPGAHYADLDRDLSDLSVRGMGRHPLPDDARFSALLSRIGAKTDDTIVAYDDANGALAAARLWWLLRLAGYENAVVLDGGFAAWRAAGLPLESGATAAHTESVHASIDRSKIVGYEELERSLADDSGVLLDARAAPRYRGEVEPLDTKAGHVPGALNRPFADNLEAGGTFKSHDRLRAEFESLIGKHAPPNVVHMCGSGVTACHNLLAMEVAGMHGSRVFAPSWSGWISDPARRIAQGSQADA